MADIIDIAHEREEELREKALAKRKPAGPKAKGRCHNCDEPLQRGQRFCDADCRDDWEFRNNVLSSQFADGVPKDPQLFDEYEESDDADI